MKDKLNAAKQKLKLLTAEDLALIFAGTLVGSAATGAAVYFKTKHDYDQLLTLPLGKEAFDALVNDETNFVRFWTGKHDHAFRVTLEQWI